MHGRRTKSFEKLVLDAEMLQMMDATFSAIVVKKLSPAWP
jgi:trimethylamine:corrinoid methyltransferase-like protein